MKEYAVTQELRSSELHREYLSADPVKKTPVIVVDLMLNSPKVHQVMSTWGASLPGIATPLSELAPTWSREELMQMQEVQVPREMLFFLREIMTLSKISEEALPRLVDFGVVEGVGRLVYDAPIGSKGPVLDSLVQRAEKKEKNLAESTAVVTILPLVKSVARVHERLPSFSVGEIQPHNLVLIEGRKLSMKTWGVARFLPPQLAETYVKESEAFNAPERNGMQYEDVATDIYMLASSLYFLIMGKPPQRTGRMWAPLSGAGVSSHMEQTLFKSMDVEPKNRFSSVDLLRDALLGKKEEVAAPVEEEPQIRLGANLENVSAGRHSPGQTAQGQFVVTNNAGGAVKVETVDHWLTVTPREFTEKQETLTWWCVTDGLEINRTHRSMINIVNGAGDRLKIPFDVQVSGNVQAAFADLAVRTGVIAVLAGVALMVWRFMDPTGFHTAIPWFHF
ncbi:MAG: protein kinase family protein [Candidatus Xenobia bacterium]